MLGMSEIRAYGGGLGAGSCAGYSPAMKKASAAAPSKRRRSCPICSKPAATEFLPFCSRRCADLDLGRWLEGSYRIPAVEPPDGYEEDGPRGTEAPDTERD